MNSINRVENVMQPRHFHSGNLVNCLLYTSIHGTV